MRSITKVIRQQFFGILALGGLLTAVASAATGGPALLGKSNSLSGLVTMESGKTITISPTTALDPEFKQADFDSSYACTADLLATIPVQ